MSLSMSGYLPGDDHDGLSRLAPRLIATTDAVIDGEADEDAADVVIVGIVRGHSVKRKRSGDDDTVVEVRLHRIEAVDGPEADQVRAMVLRLADSRSGVSTLPGMPGAAADELPDPTQVVDPDTGDDDVAKRRRQRKAKPTDPPFTGDTPPADQ